MVAAVAVQVSQVPPTAFHKLLKELDDRGSLRRIYTQNIDGLEKKVGISYGIPPLAMENHNPKGSRRPPSATQPVVPIPRCLPIHGSLDMRCRNCNHVQHPLTLISALNRGFSIPCPSCKTTAQSQGRRPQTRTALIPSIVLYGDSHPLQEQIVSCIRQDCADEGGPPPDLLVVAGTSLELESTQRIVTDFVSATRR